MRRFLLTLVGVMCIVGSASAQDPNDAFIPDIQNEVFPENTFVVVKGVHVTSVAPFGVWVQESEGVGPERAGIWCYTQTAPGVEIGDVIDISGEYLEFFDLSEIDVTLGGTLVSSAEPVGAFPAPLLVTPDDIPPTGGVSTEDYEGVLVTLDDLEVFVDRMQFGEYQLGPIGNPLGTQIVCDDTATDAPALPPVGAQFNSVTGVLHYSFEEYKLNPRTNDDFDWLDGEPAPGLETAYCTSNTEVIVLFDRDVDQVTAEDTINYFFNNLGDFAAAATQISPDEVLLTTSAAFEIGSTVPEQLDVSAVENTTNGAAMGTESLTFIGGVNTIEFVQTIGSGLDSSQVAGEVVTVEGIVTGDNDGDYVPPDGNRYYIETAGGGPLSGIFVFDRAHTVQRGDEVRVAGTCLEFVFKTEIDDPWYVEILSTGNTIPGPDLVTTGILTSSALAEPWEGVFVRVEDVVVNQDTSFGFNEWTIIAMPGATDTTVVGDEGVATYDPTAGDMHDFIQGPLDYSFGNPKIQPRNDSDIAGSGVGVSDQGVPTAKTALLNGFPNPFNPSTSLEYQLGASSHVSVKVFDESGRLVRTLVDDVVAAGVHTAQWDGRDDGGRGLASGIYMYRFEADGIVETSKITLLK